jgi:hypothetical protein
VQEEEGMLIAQANIEMENSGKIIAENVIARQEGDFPVIDLQSRLYRRCLNQIVSFLLL